ncbi:MAG: glucosamine-6-phosphate deaminase [Cellvibrio sp.]|uniref:glucosamine-6-phosphate deaminase n=1 Tax=Cellvibrio sp. TaxID=1965322 RepID=UPI00319FF906
MKFNVFESEELLGKAAAELAAATIRQAAQVKDVVTIVVATGSSQFSMLKHLVEQENMPWEKVQAFHLDEYIGISATHPASFRKYLNERFVSQIPDLKKMTLINANSKDIPVEVARLNSLIANEEIDVCLAGIGENGHLAFNDPPANFDTTEPYIVVDLDQGCRQQQCNEGWFESIDTVPSKAISMSINQIMKSKKIILSVLEERKAIAVKNTVTQKVSPEFPASILQNHPDCEMFLDKPAASLLNTTVLNR